MSETVAKSVDNGVKVEALVAAREALTNAPDGGPIQVARGVRMEEWHSQPFDRRELLWPWRGAAQKKSLCVRCRSS